ncbi:helix-turn-helix domain-containing protein [Elioraea tepidiphila]|uniref:helix-turn-helix domain-containing protein n=1 Tax=Elioraea tepidiphila TaxID=457934 RepID=UPI001FDFFCE2|nr:helix-turn-helix domain-containing protein [Elioraea tepidiphila]
MPTARKSALRSAPSAMPSERSTRGRALVAAAREVAAYLRGEPGTGVREYRVHVPETVDVAAIRAALGLSQPAFARHFGLDVTAVQAWEQGRRHPDRAARVLLAVIAREPEAVARALEAEAA